MNETQKSEQRVRVIRNDDAAQYEALLDDERAGVIEYLCEDDVITYLHTLVPDEFGGRGVASAIAKYALDDARKNGWQVVPRCPFVSGYILKHPEYADLVLTT